MQFMMWLVMIENCGSVEVTMKQIRHSPQYKVYSTLIPYQLVLVNGICNEIRQSRVMGKGASAAKIKGK